jgi:hypothetical protein
MFLPDGNTGDPTGLVTFLDGSTPLGTATLSNGSAAINASFAVTGVHAITAQMLHLALPCP